MAEHELKTVPPYYADVAEGRKWFDVRPDDRDFQIGDTLRLREFADGEYTGRECQRIITYILPGGEYSTAPGRAVLGLAVPPPECLDALTSAARQAFETAGRKNDAAAAAGVMTWSDPFRDVVRAVLDQLDLPSAAVASEETSDAER